MKTVDHERQIEIQKSNLAHILPVLAGRNAKFANAGDGESGDFALFVHNIFEAGR
ncbi:MAG: hypothetical protein Tsb009_22160 [Planctomycetaceae bacterium]